MIHALHGNLGSVSDWEALALSGLVRHDLWSDLEAAPDLTLEGWADRFAGSLEDPAPVLLGYSMGGRLALHAMIAAPEKWKGAIIVSAHPGLADKDGRKKRLDTDREWANRARISEWRTFLDTWNTQTVFSGDFPSPAQESLEPRREAIARAFENWSLGNQQTLGDQLNVCHFPVLWVTGENDEKFTALAAGLKGILSDFEHVVLSGCGHRAIFEKPVEVAETIRDFQKRRL